MKKGRRGGERMTEKSGKLASVTTIKLLDTVYRVNEMTDQLWKKFDVDKRSIKF